MDSFIGRQIGDYRIIELIGSGGMGSVYRAEHVHLRTTFAVKILPHELAADPGFVARFHDEAHVMAKLRHPRIVQVHNMSEAGGVYFLAMDYVTGPEGKPHTCWCGVLAALKTMRVRERTVGPSGACAGESIYLVRVFPVRRNHDETCQMDCLYRGWGMRSDVAHGVPC
ncbi:MAG TPA: protein kinase [Phycisphaerae bacterium]|nr:protein kinase [Phycisphaerae bacterium]HUW33952.1 protein kinase [Planctomycetota bacterium]